MWHSCFPMMGRAPPPKEWSPSRILMDDTANEDAHYKCFCEALVNKMKNRLHDQCFLLVDKKWDKIQVIRKHCPYDLPEDWCLICLTSEEYKMTQLMKQDDINYFGLEARVQRENIRIEFWGKREDYTGTLVCRIGYHSPDVAEPETRLSNSKETEPGTQLSNTKKERM